MSEERFKPDGLTLDEVIEMWKNHPDKSERLSPWEELALRGGMKLASALTALLVFMDTLSGEDAVLSKDDRREAERLLKTLSPDIGKSIEQFNNIQDSIANPLAVGTKRSLKTIRQVLRWFKKGDHIAVDRDLYSHHAIYDGNGGVVEYDDYIVKTATLANFAQGAKIYKVEEDAVYTPEEIMERAYSRMGERQYDLLSNNCENFATWCRCG